MLTEREGDRLGTVGDSELLEDDGEVLQDAALGNSKFTGDVVCRVALGRGGQDLKLAVG